MIDIIETVYRGASKGRGLVVSPKGKFTPFSYTAAILFTDHASRLFDTLPLLNDILSTHGLLPRSDAALVHWGLSSYVCLLFS